MYVTNQSGQILGFSFISSTSGLAMTGLSGLVNGYVTIDHAAQTTIQGNVIEAGNGGYIANLYSQDINGSICSFLFTAPSGAVPVEKTVVTTLSISGQIFTASGIYTTATVQSGTTYLASGTPTLVYSGQLSGQNVNLLSGLNSVIFASGSITAFTYASGANIPLSGFTFIASGAYVNATATVSSGVSVIATLYSGQSTLTYSGQLSGQPIAGLSGRIYPASGAYVNATATVNSGLSVIATLYSGQLSGQLTTLLSGYSYPASGVYTTSQGGSASSGLSVIATLYSGQTTQVYSGSLSGQPIVAQSGLSVTVYSATLSGLSINVSQIYTYDISGSTPPTHSLVNALRKLVNKWDTTTNSGYLTVFKEDALTQAYTQIFSSTSGGPTPTGLGDA